MASLKSIINSSMGKNFISILLGLGLAALFKKSCNKKSCLIFKAKQNKIKNQIFKFDNKCYLFNNNATTCNNKKK